MAFRATLVGFLVGFVGLMMGMMAPPAHALTPIALENLSYQECPAEYADGMVTAGSMRQATCYLITGQAVNKSGKPVLNADIFGRIFDANNNPVMQNRSRLGSIEYVPPGESDFELRVSVAANQPAPLKLKQFKASGFAGKVRR
ncbi:MAG: hypothetical protein AAFZ80_13960 [Cyanobacteria bacterium P01_A01_bin.105]